MHGSDDALVPADASRLLAARAGSADLRLEIYAGLHHELFNEPEHDAVLTTVSEWLEARS